jgi:hypothetical protein
LEYRLLGFLGVVALACQRHRVGRHDRNYRPRLARPSLYLLQCYAVQFQGGKASQKERGREGPPRQLVRDGRLGFGLETVFFEPFCQFGIGYLGRQCVAWTNIPENQSERSAQLQPVPLPRLQFG